MEHLIVEDNADSYFFVWASVLSYKIKCSKMGPPPLTQILRLPQVRWLSGGGAISQANSSDPAVGFHCRPQAVLNDQAKPPSAHVIFPV